MNNQHSIDLSKHYSLLSSNDVSSICRPLLKLINVDYYSYIKIDTSNGARILLTTSPDWIYHFYKTGLFGTKSISSAEFTLPAANYFWNCQNSDKAFSEGQYFNIKRGVTIIKNTATAKHIHVFGTSYDISDEFFMSNIDLLEAFIVYFYDKAQEVINIAEQSLIYLPEDLMKVYLSQDDKIQNNDFRSQFISKVNSLNNLYVQNNCYLTQREIDCLFCLLEGNSAKQSAKLLSISHRTVEAHFDNIKNKLQCNSKYEILKTMLKNDLYKQVLNLASFNRDV